MTSRPALRNGRGLARLAVVSAVAVSVPLAVAGTAGAAPDSVWERLAQCESGGNWSINTGNGYYGGLQFSPATWRAFGGTGMPHQASRGQQIAVAERTLAAQGWNAWPSCSRKMGLRGYAAEPGKARSSSSSSQAAPAARSSSGRTHTVTKGETLSKIAAAHGTSWQALYKKNRGTLSNPNVLKIGQELAL
jgi:LysM repeat protein